VFLPFLFLTCFLAWYKFQNKFVESPSLPARRKRGVNIAGNMAATATHGANDGWRRDWREKLTPSEVSFMQGGIKKGRGALQRSIAKSTAAHLFFLVPQ
jgi:hypothetical protein